MKLLLSCAVLLTYLAAAFVPVPAEDPELARFAGTWQAIEAEYGGETIPALALEKIVITVVGVRYTEKTNDKVIEEGSFVLRPAAKPREIDILPTFGKDKGKRQLGIYKFEKGNLVLTVTLEKHEKRPATFTTQQDDTFQTIIFRRVKEETKP